MRVNQFTSKVFYAEKLSCDGQQLTVEYDNRGEPFRDGITLSLTTGDKNHFHVFLNRDEAGRLRNLIDELLPPRRPSGS